MITLEKEILYIDSWNYGEELKKVNKLELSHGCRCDLEVPWDSEKLLEGHWRQYNPRHKSEIYADLKHLRNIFTKLVLSM